MKPAPSIAELSTIQDADPITGQIDQFEIYRLLHVWLRQLEIDIDPEQEPEEAKAVKVLLKWIEYLPSEVRDYLSGWVGETL